MKHKPSRLLAALLCAQLLTACSATAQPAVYWPQPQAPAQDEPAHPALWPPVRQMPDFQAPSASHCARPVRTREVPGRQGGAPDHGVFPEGRHDRLAGSAAHAAEAAGKRAAPSGASAPAAAAPSARAEAGDSASMPFAQRSPEGLAASQLQPMAEPLVTAGVVDDNSDFSAYLDFLGRHPVPHRPRDVRERYLLEVKDARGRGVADAEVMVQAASGYATWARTDAAGRAWLHPNAFDPAHSRDYAVTTRKGGLQAHARLTRGQRSAVEVRLDAAAPARARLDLVFLIDATGSMADEIDKLKATLRSITAELTRLPSRPDLCLGLVAYRDRGDEFLLRSHDFTDDVGGFLRTALYPLRADGGGDYPEALSEGLHETVHRLSWRGSGTTRIVVLLADAPPQLDESRPPYDEAMLAALGKGIKVFGVGASGLDRQGEVIQRQIAQYTGGRFVFLTYAQAHRPGSGPGRETVHDVKNYSVDTLDRLIVRLLSEELGQLALAP